MTTKPPDGVHLNEYVASLVNDKLRTSLLVEYPTHNLFTKGSQDIGNCEFEWICDPLDGAFIYSKGFTNVALSMTLVHNGIPVLVGIELPFLGNTYIAQKGKGVTKNDTKLIPLRTKLEKFAMINAEWWPAATYDVDRLVHSLSDKYHLYPIHIGSVVYSACMVAEGALVASLFGGLLIGKNHEAAAVMLLMQEIGGQYTDLNGQAIGFTGAIHGFVISGNNDVHDQLIVACKALVK